jgi:2-polyprenyl-3-methyl-5-hydroxy-6-metoxy-1,4-benzoquinol methylase
VNNTGERHIINQEIIDETEYYIHLMHIATYQFALKYVQGKRVLDYGCGSGYGSQMLSSLADKVIGVDVSVEAIEFANRNYSSGNIIFKDISELGDEKFDVITSFQVIEHVTDDKEYIRKLKKMLNPDGCLLISTPDKKNRLFNFIQKPWNVFHLREYSGTSLTNLLLNYFTEVEVLNIGSEYDFVMKEISRTKKQRIITLPCTLIFYPDFLRIFLLNFQASIYKALNKLRKGKKIKKTFVHQDDFKKKYSVEDIEINRSLTLSTDLLAICSK